MDLYRLVWNVWWEGEPEVECKPCRKDNVIRANARTSVIYCGRRDALRRKLVDELDLFVCCVSHQSGKEGKRFGVKVRPNQQTTTYGMNNEWYPWKGLLSLGLICSQWITVEVLEGAEFGEQPTSNPSTSSSRATQPPYISKPCKGDLWQSYSCFDTSLRYRLASNLCTLALEVA